jgi:nickel transport protein
MANGLAGLLIAAALAVTGVPAQAHKIIASVFPSGADVEGEIGFSNGDMATDTLVEVFDPQGNKLDEVTTDSDGFFVYTPSGKVDLVFRADLGAGHIAEARFAIADLTSVANGVEANATTQTATAIAQSSEPERAIPKAQEELIAGIVRGELRPLRREISAYKEKNDLQSILGGIGYVFGFFGIAYYLAARRLKAKATKS